MSHAPIPARFYPAGGDAHGHPALVELAGDVLQVLPEDSLPRQVPLAGLQAAGCSVHLIGGADVAAELAGEAVEVEQDQPEHVAVTRARRHSVSDSPGRGVGAEFALW